MMGSKVEFKNNTPAVLRRVEKGEYETFKHAGRSLAKEIKKSIRHRSDPSKTAEPGETPFQHQPGFFKRAVWVVYDDLPTSILVGFRKSKVGHVAATHEHGLMEDVDLPSGMIIRTKYPERPIVAPALERNLGRFHRDWRAALT